MYLFKQFIANVIIIVLVTIIVLLNLCMFISKLVRLLNVISVGLWSAQEQFAIDRVLYNNFYL